MPSRSTLIVITLLIALTVLTGWNYLTKPFGAADTAVTTSPSPSIDPSSDDPETTLLANMTPEQKVAAIMAIPVTLTASPSASYMAELEWIAQHRPGAVTVFGTNVSLAQLERLKQDLRATYSTREMAKEPLLIVDHEGGQVQRLSGTGFTRLPSWQSLCNQPASQSAALIETSLTELQTAGIDLILSPTVDVASSHAILRDRVCSGDPEVVVERSIEFIEIAQAVGLKPVIKHFPGIGATTSDLHFAFDRVSVTPADALLFKFILERFPQLGIMVTPVGVNNQFPNIPCTLSYDCVKELSSNFPQALTVTDGLDMAASRYNDGQELLSISEAAVRAVRAGNNLLIFGPDMSVAEMDDTFKALVAGYDSDPLIKESVDAGALKVQELERTAL